MIKTCILALGLSFLTTMANAENISSHVGECIDMEYYDDILHYSGIFILGYVLNGSSIFDENGNPDISDVIIENGKVYVAKFNVYENTVCIRKTSNEKIEYFSYEEYNPWQNM